MAASLPPPAPLGFDAMTALKAVCLLSGLAMHVAPLPVMREMEAARSTLNFSVVPYAGPLLNHLVNLWYAVVRRDGPLVVHRLLGIAAQAYYIRTFFRFVAPKREPDARRAVLVAAACLAGVAADLHGALPALGLSADLYYPHLAFFAFVTGVGLAASPLATVGEVLRTRDASSLPAHLCAMVTLQCFSWMIYGYLRDDLSTFANNLIGVALGGSQLALIAVFGSSRDAAAGGGGAATAGGAAGGAAGAGGTGLLSVVAAVATGGGDAVLAPSLGSGGGGASHRGAGGSGGGSGGGGEVADGGAGAGAGGRSVDLERGSPGAAAASERERSRERAAREKNALAKR